ncbi:OmpA family protein [Marichromatium sp. AB31]|uniref:OmpA family protein n=1 Tax=Marichromatium sp. AB31 TaxID=2483362 RepID=UPI000F3D74E0|nr:OmpA family protein [Marichromatium sp. AB31]MBO8085566.1 OmpA family protein [Marichromatium sp.]RNE91524.1 OmpA family protein [Marichromatium sp. AB31]
MKHTALTKGTAVAAVVAVLISGCAADGSGMTETGQGAAIGTATGAAAGAIIGSFGGNAGRGALIGAVGGALAGGMVGAYMEEQRRDFERALADEIARGVIRVQLLPGDQLVVGMTGATTFEVDSDRIKPGFYSTMDKIAAIVRRYGKTELRVAGHTDSTGSASYNQTLSERRAVAVEGYLERSGVMPQRIFARGYGQDRPIASNASEAGRRLNRRVEITIVPIQARG